MIIVNKHVCLCPLDFLVVKKEWWLVGWCRCGHFSSEKESQTVRNAGVGIMQTQEGTAWKQMEKEDFGHLLIWRSIKDFKTSKAFWCWNHLLKSGSDFLRRQNYEVLSLFFPLTIINPLNGEWQLLTAENDNFSLTIQTATTTKTVWIRSFSCYFISMFLFPLQEVALITK